MSTSRRRRRAGSFEENSEEENDVSDASIVSSSDEAEDDEEIEESERDVSDRSFASSQEGPPDNKEKERDRKSDPSYVPTRGNFFLHDDRFIEGRATTATGSSSSQRNKASVRRGRGRGRGDQQSEKKWSHDKFVELEEAANEQAPSSKQRTRYLKNRGRGERRGRERGRGRGSGRGKGRGPSSHAERGGRATYVPKGSSISKSLSELTIANAAVEAGESVEAKGNTREQDNESGDARASHESQRNCDQSSSLNRINVRSQQGKRYSQQSSQYQPRPATVSKKPQHFDANAINANPMPFAVGMPPPPPPLPTSQQAHSHMLHHQNHAMLLGINHHGAPIMYQDIHQQSDGSLFIPEQHMIMLPSGEIVSYQALMSSVQATWYPGNMEHVLQQQPPSQNALPPGVTRGTGAGNWLLETVRQKLVRDAALAQKNDGLAETGKQVADQQSQKATGEDGQP